MEEASFLSRYASKVYIIHRFDYLEASKVMQRRVLSNPKIEVRQWRCWPCRHASAHAQAGSKGCMAPVLTRLICTSNVFTGVQVCTQLPLVYAIFLGLAWIGLQLVASLVGQQLGTAYGGSASNDNVMSVFWLVYRWCGIQRCWRLMAMRRAALVSWQTPTQTHIHQCQWCVVLGTSQWP